MAEKKRFELSRAFRPLTVFETIPFNHLGTSPSAIILYICDFVICFSSAIITLIGVNFKLFLLFLKIFQEFLNFFPMLSVEGGQKHD